ncbi:hypothetical protein R6Q59_010020 [Mikania micrantha]
MQVAESQRLLGLLRAWRCLANTIRVNTTMETVFITIHDLSLDARVKYCSDSVEDILGYLPHEVKGKSCWEYFHPDEIPFAKAIHGRGVSLDKAAVMNYCRIKHKDGRWIGCECVFTVVYDVLVASTAIYQRGPKSRKRAIDGADVRRIFSSSPRDPRYHMLSFISNKFYQEPRPHGKEPRAALFLNRYTRTSTIMFATNGVSTILGLRPDQLVGKSFYECIAENCLDDAVRCLESAKGNDSVAYLRFWYRDVTQDDRRTREPSIFSAFSEDDDDGGVPVASVARSASSAQMPSRTPLTDPILTPTHIPSEVVTPQAEPDSDIAITVEKPSPSNKPCADQPRSSSNISANSETNARDPIFDPPSVQPISSTSSTTPMEEPMTLEIEAVVSCTSDGLVLVLRRARPLVPHTASITDEPYFANGMFASPWATEPVLPPDMDQAAVAPDIGFPAVSKPTESGFMAAIRDVAVFAWSLTGINGSLVSHARGSPMGESLPPGGLPVWDPNAGPEADDRWNGFSNSTHRRCDDLGPKVKDEEVDSSDDEILWKRVTQMPPYKRPKRRAHHDAFGDDPHHQEVGYQEKQIRRRKLDGGK